MRPLINEVVQLCKDIAYYANMFPDVEPVTYDQIEQNIEKYQDRYNVGDTFGYSVSPEWEDKCFCFQVLIKDETQFVVQYIGVYKG